MTTRDLVAVFPANYDERTKCVYSHQGLTYGGLIVLPEVTQMEVDDGKEQIVLEMNDPHVGILIPPLVWCKLYDFTPEAACVSLASEPYSAEDYIHDYEEFLELTTE